MGVYVYVIVYVYVCLFSVYVLHMFCICLFVKIQLSIISICKMSFYIIFTFCISSINDKITHCAQNVRLLNLFVHSDTLLHNILCSSRFILPSSRTLCRFVCDCAKNDSTFRANTMSFSLYFPATRIVL